MSNPVSASNAWSKIQKKITAQAGDVSVGGTPEVQTPKATPSKKRAAAAKVSGDDDDEESPVKKVKTPSRKKVVKSEPVEDASSGAGGDEVGDGEEQNFF
jgi:hypothetical protein